MNNNKEQIHELISPVSSIFSFSLKVITQCANIKCPHKNIVENNKANTKLILTTYDADPEPISKGFERFSSPEMFDKKCLICKNSDQVRFQ